MILSGQFFTNSTLHQPGQGGQDVDWWVNLSVVQLSVDEDLAFCNVACKIGYRMRDIYEVTSAACCGCLQHRRETLPSFGMVRMGICVIEPFRP